MSSTMAAAMRRGCQPGSVVGPEKPNPGSDAQTTMKRFAQWLNDTQHLDDRARPPVQDQERQGVRGGGASVDEMDRLPINAWPCPAASH